MCPSEPAGGRAAPDTGDRTGVPDQPGPGTFGEGGGEVVPLTSLASTPPAGAVQVLHHGAERFYELVEDGVSVGMLIYETSPGHVSITHAMIRADRRGAGLGATLIPSALDHLTARGAPVRVYCATVAGFLQRFPQYADRVHPEGVRAPSSPAPGPVG